MGALWDGIARANDDEDMAMLHQLGRDASTLACNAIRVASLANRAEASCAGWWELPAEERGDIPAGQENVDEATGEVVDPGQAE